MIDKARLEEKIDEYLSETKSFLISLEVSAGNDIQVLIDNDENTSVSDCIGLNKHLEKSMDRDEEDFSIQVSSPGLKRAFTHVRQYIKNIGRDVKVLLVEGQKVEGKLVKADEEGIEVLTKRKERIEGRKAKRWVEENHAFTYEEINETKVVITFK
jgi:ribosome maturation factor RimP